MFKAALVVCVLVTSSACTAQKKSSERTTFTVVTYNVENLFDVDGVAMFDDYQQDGESDGDDPFGYSRAKFLTKLQNIAAVLKTVNEGDGPEVVLFQELEADFTPGNSVEDPIAFVAQYADASIADMLTVGWSDQYAGVPSVAWLLKALSDAGLTGYDVVSVDGLWHRPHQCRLFQIPHRQRQAPPIAAGARHP
jgi:hypothetical protein